MLYCCGMTQRPPYLSFDPATRRLRLDPHDGRFVQNPYEAYAWLHHASPSFFWENYGFWCFGGFDEVNRLLRDRRFGRQRPEGAADNQGNSGARRHLANFDAVEANSMLELEPPVHTRLRTLVNRAFVSRQVERLRPRIQALANSLIDGFPTGGRVDLLPAYAAPLPITIIAEMLGVPVEMGPQLLDWSHSMVAMYMHGRTRDSELAADAAARAFTDFLRGYVARRRSEPGDDLLSLLISAQEDGQKLSEDELVSSAILLLNAGHEATVHQTGNAVRSILAQGGDPRRFLATAEATAATVEECLRFDPPLHMFTRYAYGDIEIGDGIAVRAGQQIGLLLGMANRDPRAFDGPDLFDPARAGQKNVSFGAGIHFCIGAPLARLELQVSLKTLFDRLPGLALADEPRFRDTYHFHGLETLAVALPPGGAKATA
jgi:cytochrome P450